MFRTADNIPEYYVNNSRDFQLLCRAKDASFNGVKYNINSINHISNTLEINSRLLSLLKSKLGFFSEDRLSEDQLRYLLAGFPKIIREKGSTNCILQIINLWLRLYQIDGKLTSVAIDNDTHKIRIRMSAIQNDTKLLDEMFKYVLPTSYEIVYEFGLPASYNTTILFDDSDFNYIEVPDNENSNIRRNYDKSKGKLQDRLIGNIGLTQIVRDNTNQNNSEGEESNEE